MLYNNYPQNSNRTGNAKTKNTNQIQTDGILLTNEPAGRYLKTRFWAKCMGIDIGVFTPGEVINSDTFKNAQVFGHVFSFSTLFELHDICEEVLQALQTANQFESTATEAGQKKDAIVEISNGSNIGKPAGIYLVIYKNVDPGRRSNTYEAYPFGSIKVMRNYDHATGAYKEDIKATGDFRKFVFALHEATKAFTMAQAHAIRDASKFDKLASFNAIAALSAGLGIDISKSIDMTTSRYTGKSNYSRDNNKTPEQYQRTSPSGQWNGNNSYGNPPWNGNGNTNGYQKTQQAMAAVNDEPVDINIDMAQLQNVGLDNFS